MLLVSAAVEPAAADRTLLAARQHRQHGRNCPRPVRSKRRRRPSPDGLRACGLLLKDVVPTPAPSQTSMCQHDGNLYLAPGSQHFQRDLVAMAAQTQIDAGIGQLQIAQDYLVEKRR